MYAMPLEDDQAMATDTTCTYIMIKFGHVVHEQCSQTDRQTDSHAHHYTLLPCWGRV